MIAKHTLGQGFAGLLAYVLREGMAGREGEATLLGGNMSGQCARALAREFAVFRRLNSAVRRPVFHASLRLPAGESLSDAQWRHAAATYLARMGYTDTAYVVVRHPEHHIHIVASRVRFDGTSVATWRDRWRGLAAVEAIERRFGLSHPRRSSPAGRERRMQRAHGEPRISAPGVPRSRQIQVDHLRGAMPERASGQTATVAAVPGAIPKSSAPTVGAAPPIEVPARLVREARTSLAQQRRWNGHLSEEAVLRLAAIQLVRQYPQEGVSTVLAALEAAKPGSLATCPGGASVLADQLGTAIAMQVREDAPTYEARDCSTR